MSQTLTTPIFYRAMKILNGRLMKMKNTKTLMLMIIMVTRATTTTSIKNSPSLIMISRSLVFATVAAHVKST